MTRNYANSTLILWEVSSVVLQSTVRSSTHHTVHAPRQPSGACVGRRRLSPLSREVQAQCNTQRRGGGRGTGRGCAFVSSIIKTQTPFNLKVPLFNVLLLVIGVLSKT